MRSTACRLHMEQGIHSSPFTSARTTPLKMHPCMLHPRHTHAPELVLPPPGLTHSSSAVLLILRSMPMDRMAPAPP